MTNTFRRTLRRITPAVVAFACLLSPAVGRAQVGTPPSVIGMAPLGPGIGRWSYSLLAALDIPPSGLSVGPRVTGEIMYGFMDLAPQLRLDLGGRVSFNYHSGDFDSSFWALDFVPDAKLRYAINDQWGIYGDVGLGLAYMHVSASATGVVNGQIVTVSGSDSSVSFTVQFGAGAVYAITPNINLLGEVRFDIYTKSGTGTFIAIPTVGLEFH